MRLKKTIVKWFGIFSKFPIKPKNIYYDIIIIATLIGLNAQK
jgi:hypothetical protein